MTEEQRNLIAPFLNEDGTVKEWPARHNKKDAVCVYLGERFEKGRVYTEKEVNALLDAAHTFGDYFLLRRELVERGVLTRKSDGSEYRAGE